MERKLTITTASHRKSRNWQGRQVTWQRLVMELSEPITGSETYHEFMTLPKSKQDDLKDVGGFVGGSFSGNRRLSQELTGRDLITLDLDEIPAGKTDEIIETVRKLPYKACVYSTRKHSERKPRLRIILPLDRTVMPDEYEPIARSVCNEIGMVYADATTFDASRLMYWPSHSKEADWVNEAFGGIDVPADEILGRYKDWKDPTEWPVIPGFEIKMKRTLAKAEDPLTKKGLVGAFCRAYSIQEAMDKFLPGLYEETTDPNRRTYAGGSTYGGAVIYDSVYVYSHHATDPISGILCNAWDMVRLHMYGERDLEKENSPMPHRPSYMDMCIMAENDELVKKTLADDRAKEVIDAFSDEVPVTKEDVDWVKKLSITKRGEFEKTIGNFVQILSNDPTLKGKVAVERFANKEVITGKVPWDDPETKYPRMISDSDASHIMDYIEKHYRGLYHKDKINNAFNIVGAMNSYNVIEDYLNGLEWDRTPRVETLLTDYLGAEDNAYTRAVIRKTLIAAAMRATAKESVKFDPMPILIGEQGIGKSTFIRYLAVNESWYDESLSTFEGKDAAEHIQGSWIVEVSELAAMNKQELSSVKSFQTRTTDRFRQAYGHHTMEYIRRCVFIGTTNEDEFLRDNTGNRRFWPIETYAVTPTKDVFTDLPEEIDQIWAEVMTLVRAESESSLDMDSAELKELSMLEQEKHRQASPLEGMIESFMDEEIPVNWLQMDLVQRAAWRSNPDSSVETKLRDRICAEEIWVECLNGARGKCTIPKRNEINAALATVTKQKGWVRKPVIRCGSLYGSQRGYLRKE